MISMKGALAELIAFLFRDVCYLEDEEGTSIEFDAVSSENWSNSGSVANYPIEKGKDVSDCMKNSEIEGSLKAVISNHSDYNPISVNNLIRKAGALAGVPSIITDFLVTDTVKVRKDQLYKWKEEKTLLSYYGAVEEVDNILITKLNPSKDSSTGIGLNFDIGLKKVRIVEAQIGMFNIPILSAMSSKAKGLSPTSSMKVSPAEKKKSILAGLL